MDDCYARGVIKGITEHQFGPNQNLTRGMLVTMLYRYAGSPEMTGETSFSDVREGRYFYQAVIWAEKNQIANGYPDGTFQPNQNITREQMVTMLFRYVQSQDGDNGLRDDLAAFEDRDKVSNFAKGAHGVGGGQPGGQRNDRHHLGPRRARPPGPDGDGFVPDPWQTCEFLKWQKQKL